MYTTRRFDDEAIALQRQGYCLWQLRPEAAGHPLPTPNDYIFLLSSTPPLARRISAIRLPSPRHHYTHGWDMVYNFHTLHQGAGCPDLHAAYAGPDEAAHENGEHEIIRSHGMSPD